VVTLSQPTSTLVRVSGTATLSEVATAFVTPGLRLTIANGAAIDITFRIGLPQLEQGAFVTSVIPTTGTAVTRSADVASITGTNFSSWYRQDEGTVFAESAGINNIFASTTRRYYEISDGTLNNRILGGYSTLSNNRSVIFVANAIQADVSSVASPGLVTKHCLAYKANSVQVSSAGNLGTEDTSSTLPVVSTAFLGADTSATSGTYLNGTIRRLTYWPQRLSNSTLQQITR
jgi:hypothetical protein